VQGIRGFANELREVVQGRDFRRLFVTRLTSQSGDGALQVGLAGLFFFSPERATTATGIAAAFAVSVLPYTVLGPFVGVLLDRWRRRQVLLIGNAVRALLAFGIAALVLAHVVGPVLYGAVLACMSVNRFLLAGLGASLPHVVAERELVMANAVTPTAGTISAMLGALLGYCVRFAIGPGDTGDAAVVAFAALAYASASALATRMHRDLLGPEPTTPADPTPASPGREGVVQVFSDLRAGLRHLRRRPVPATALAAVGVHRFAFGAATVMTVLVCRNRLAAADQPERGFALLAAAVGLTGVGYAAAALLTPVGAGRIGPRGWIAGCLTVAGLIPAGLAMSMSTASLMTASFLLGLAGQGAKICVDALVQTGVDDDFRGRAFSVYDLVFNAAFVTAVAGSALVLPTDGYSRPWLVALATLYLTAAVTYHRVNQRLDRRHPPSRDRAFRWGWGT
jgi:MFS family permease